MEVSALTHPSAMPGLRGPSALLRLQSDERLISLTRRGQPAAFETLCARYQSRLLSFCRHMLSSREDAEDVLQEVFAAPSTPFSPTSARSTCAHGSTASRATARSTTFAARPPSAWTPWTCTSRSEEHTSE